MLIGSHMTISKGLEGAVKNAIKIGSSTMQIFTRNPRGGKAKELNQDDIKRASLLMEKNNFGPWVAHAPYTINLISPKSEIREFGVNTIIDDFQRIEKMGASFLVFHPGSHVGTGEKKGEELLVHALNRILPYCPSNMQLLIEAMAGQGTEIGYTFEQLQRIINYVEIKFNLGICLDTCHLFGAGYDVRKWGNLWSIIANTIEKDRVKVVHLNDSKFPLGSKKDRHAALGEGEIGFDGLKEIILHPSVKNMPIILETPHDLAGWAQEIEIIKKWRMEEEIN